MLFWTFPDGRLGIGLLFLRFAIGIAASMNGWEQMSHGSVAGAAAIACGIFVLAGFLTPVASSLICAAAVFILISTAAWTSLPCALVAAAMTLLGPGAISIDARLFGRREIVIPRRN